MLSVLLLFLSICLSRLVVRVGTIALELSGLPEQQANFQAISAFTNTGFTTRESELIAAHPSRRRVIRSLMLLGAAGVISSVAALAGTLISSRTIASSLMDSQQLGWLPINPAQAILLAVIIVLLFANLITSHRGLSRLLKEAVSAYLLKERLIIPSAFDELVVNNENFAVIRVEITEASPLNGSSLADAEVAQREIVVLSLERLESTSNYPPPSMVVKKGDILVLYGPLYWIRRLVTAEGLAAATDSEDRSFEQPLLSHGSEAPLFELPDQDGNPFRLADVLGKKSVILLFYPRDQSYFCSAVLKTFVDAYAELQALGAEVVAINPSSIASHRNFCQSIGTTIPILSDKGKKTCKRYNCLMLGGLLVNRTVYVVNKQGKICFAARGRPPLHEVKRILHAEHRSSLAE